MVPVRSSTTFKGEDWIGLKMRDVSVVRGIGVLPIFAGLLGLLLLIGSLAATWAEKAGNLGVMSAKRNPALFRSVWIPAARGMTVTVSQSGRIMPLTPSKAPSTSSATSSRAGSTGPGIFTWPFGMRLKPTLP